MTESKSDPALTINQSEIKGFIQANYGTVTLVYNYPQSAAGGVPGRLTPLDARSASLNEALPPCPYRGLFAFQPQDAPFFFGREAAIDRVVRLVQRGRLTAVTGASGSGKSSLVFAGVAPALMQDERWNFTTFRPGVDPFYGLAGALAPLLAQSDLSEPASLKAVTAQAADIAALAARLRHTPGELRTTLQAIKQGHPGKNLLIIGDQFEELYSLCQDEEVRRHFLDELLAITTNEETPFVRLLLTIRADFLGELVGDRRLADALQNQFDLLGPMTRAELTDAMIKPAALMDVAYEAHLVDRILDDLGDDDGALPLLEFALTQLWAAQSADGVLTHAAYEQIGRVSGAVTQHAEAAYARLDEAERQLTRRLFRRLVSLPDQDGARITRRQIDLQSLDPATQALAQGELANRRLVSISHVADQRDTVEIVHEALLVQWPELAKWLQEDRATILRLQSLTAASAAYMQADENPDLLYRGRQLRDHLTWAAAHAEELTADEHAFLNESRRRERKRNTVQYGGYVLTGLLILLAAAGATLWRSTVEPAVTIPMPAEDFNIAIANFAVDPQGVIGDPQLGRRLGRDADAVAGQLYDVLKELEGDFEATLGENTNVNILGPERFTLTGSDPASVQEMADELEANVLIYGRLEPQSGRRWMISPQFYIDHSATEELAAEIMIDQTLFESLAYLPGNDNERRAVAKEQSAGLKVLFTLYRGLDAYNKGTTDGYEDAREIFCNAAQELPAQGIRQGVDLLALFCGHAYSELLRPLLNRPDEAERANFYTDEAIAAYKTALRFNPAQIRAQVSLPAFLIMVYKPDTSCSKGDIEQIVAAEQLLHDAESAMSRLPDIRPQVKFNYLLNRGHAAYWLGLCHRQREEQWDAARELYEQAIAFAALTLKDRADVANFSMAETHAYWGSTLKLVAEQCKPEECNTLFPEDAQQLLRNAATHFDTSLTLLLEHQSEPEVAAFTRGIFIDSLYAFCMASRADLAHKQLANYSASTNSSLADAALTDFIVFYPQLRRECGL